MRQDELLELYESMSEEELAQLSDEELIEIENILSAPEEQASATRFAPSAAEMAQYKSGEVPERFQGQLEAPEKPTVMEALSTGYVEGTPFLKDAVAMADAVDEDNASFDDAYTAYKSNLEEINEDINNAERQRPVATFIGDVVGTTATMLAGGAALKGGALTARGVSMGTAVGTGAMSQLSRSEDRSLVDPLIGAGLGYVGEKGQKESEFMNDVLTQKMPEGDELVISFRDTPERMLDKIDIKKNEVGSSLTSMYRKVDSEFDVKVDIEKLKNSLQEDVVEQFARSDDPGMQKIGQELSNYINSIGKKSSGMKRETTPEGVKLIEEFVADDAWDLTRVHGLQKDIRKRIESIYKRNNVDVTVAKQQQAKVASSLGRHIDEILSTVSKEGKEDIISQVKKARTQYGNLSQMEQSVENLIRRGTPAGWEQNVKEFFSFRNAVATTMTSSVFGPTVGVPAGFALKKVIDNPKTPVYVAKGMGKLGSIISANPTGRIASRLNTASLLSDNEFKRALYGTIAEVNLKQNPIARTTDDAKTRVGDMRNYIKLNAPSMLQEFDAILEQDSDAALAGFLDNVSKMEGLNKLFEPGIGFNGKVYSPEDKAQLETQIKQTYPTSIRLYQRNRSNTFHATGKYRTTKVNNKRARYNKSLALIIFLPRTFFIITWLIAPWAFTLAHIYTHPVK
jgi:hypothetical protein